MTSIKGSNFVCIITYDLRDNKTLWEKDAFLQFYFSACKKIKQTFQNISRDVIEGKSSNIVMHGRVFSPK